MQISETEYMKIVVFFSNRKPEIVTIFVKTDRNLKKNNIFVISANMAAWIFHFHFCVNCGHPDNVKNIDVDEFVSSSEQI